MITDFKVLVLSEWRAKEGFNGEPRASSLFRTEKGTRLYDVAFGDESGVVPRNAQRLGVTAEDIDAVALSHSQ